MIAQSLSGLWRGRCISSLPALALAMFTMLALWLAPAQAGEGHDHGDAPAAAPAAEALPRFSAASEDFELVGVLAGKQLTLYLDRAATNEPVHDAAIQLDVGGSVIKANPAPDGTYQASLPQTLPEGSTPVTATMIVEGNSDLLAGDIDIHAAAHADEAGSHMAQWRRFAAWGLGGLAVVIVLALMWRKRLSRVGGAA